MLTLSSPHSRRLALLAAASTLAFAFSLRADDTDPQKTFDEVFGANWTKAIASASTLDDEALAKDLATAVKTVDMPASLIHVIVERMTTLSDKAPGALLPTIESIDKLLTLEKDAAKKQKLEALSISLLEKAQAKGDAETKALAGAKLLKRWLPLADEHLAGKRWDEAAAIYGKALKLAKETNAPEAKTIAAKLDQAAGEQKKLAEVDALEKKIEANPKDGDSRNKLIRIHLVDRDDAAAAVWFLGEGVDEKTKKLLPLAAKENGITDGPSLAELGSWYLELSDTASAPAKPVMLRRSKGYYERFLAVHKESDLLKAKATLSLEQIKQRLKEVEATAAVTTTTPGTTPSTPTPAGALTVEINGPTITDADRVDRLYQQHSRTIAKQYFAIGGDYAPILDYDPKFPSSAKETLATAKARMTTTRVDRVGLITKKVTVPPISTEAEAVAMGLPSFETGAWGYIHSAEIAEIVGPEELLIKNLWLVDAESLRSVDYREKVERDKLARRQGDWNFGGNLMRLHGYPTAGLKIADRIGITGKGGKPLQICILGSEAQKNVFKPQRPIATLTTKFAAGLDEKQFEDLLAKRNLTRTDFVNLFLEAQRNGAKEMIANTVQRIEAKGAKLP